MTEDVVNHPSHYAFGRDFEPIDVIIDWELGYLEGQVVKYLARLGRKDDAVQDAKKAQFYLKRLVQELEDKAGTEAESEARKEPRITGISLAGETAGYMDLMGDAE